MYVHFTTFVEEEHVYPQYYPVHTPTVLYKYNPHMSKAYRYVI